MKKILPAILLFLLATTSFAQKIRFSDTTNRWKVFYYMCGGMPGVSYDTTRYTSDTVYTGINYHILSNAYDKALIREDTVAHRVYGIRLNSVSGGSDTIEKLLYDYALAFGDTFTCPVAKHVVQAIDSIVINGVWHKVWRMQAVSCFGCGSSGFAFGYCVIEGIGSTANPLTPLYPVTFEQCISLTCFNNRGSTPALSDTVGAYFDNVSSCSLTFGLAINDLTNGRDLKVYPVPATDEVTISSPLPITSLQISNVLGQVVYRGNFNAREVTVSIADLPIGTYIMRVNETELRKFVK